VQRIARARLVGLVFVGLAMLSLTACSSEGSGPSPSSAGDRDAKAVIAAVDRYFGSALPSGDWEQVARASTGPLRVQAGWLAAQGITATSGQTALDIQRLQVISISGAQAVVALDATRTVGDRDVAYGGPVTLVRTNGAWRVADYTRNGRSVAASTFIDAAGAVRRDGIVVDVVGAQLEAGHVDVWVRLENTTSGRLEWDRPIVIVDRTGEQLGRGALFVSSTDTTEGFVMMPRVSVFGDFVVDNVTLPLSTTSFRLLAGATDERTHRSIDLSVTVHL
jgi:hypothetical protein